MAAMESSTKNATEMLGKLTLSYNRQVMLLAQCTGQVSADVTVCHAWRCNCMQPVAVLYECMRMP